VARGAWSRKKEANCKAMWTQKESGLSEEHALSGDCRESYGSGHRKTQLGKGHSPTGNCRGRDEPGHRKKVIR